MNLEDLKSSLNYYLTDYWIGKTDPTVGHWPLVSNGPGKLLLLILSYVIFSTLGPLLMRGRKAFDCRLAMILHNLLLIAINGIFFIRGLQSTNFGIKTWQCGLKTTAEDEQLFSLNAYWYMMTKLLDFGDTIFLVLRKKTGQLSVLHISHHAVMPIPIWLSIHMDKSYSLVFWALVNTFVHTVMYTYYLLSRFELFSSIRSRFKKRITQLQMIQFILIFIHGLRANLDQTCALPKLFQVLEILMPSYFFLMFANFYKKSYVKRGGNNENKVKSN